ncbi:MAG: DUF4097 family beta strand repeat-containing protein [Marinicella sp.]
MNHIIKLTSILLCSVLLSSQVEAKKKLSYKDRYNLSQSESINEVLKFDAQDDNNHLTVFNVYGSIDVEGYDGDEIVIEANNLVFANSQELVDAGINEIGLRFEKTGHKIYVILDSPYTYFDQEEDKIWHSDTCWRHDDCSRKHTDKKDYKYHMDIKVLLPQNTNIKLSAINQGNITVTGVNANTLDVSNINGAIDMVDVSGQTKVNAINKDINIAYNTNPSFDSKFESINGDLNIVFAGEPNAILTYQTMHGDFYTRYDVSMMEPMVQTTSKKKEHGIKYKLDANNRLLVGSGGPEYRFETLNGDIKIK